MRQGRIERAFSQAGSEGRVALIIYLTACDPDFEGSLRLCRAALEAGADMLELGLPFSDPIADGPTIQSATQRALLAGATPKRVLELASKLRGFTDRPLLILSYANPVFRYRGGGGETNPFPFVSDAASAGVDGLIVPDLPAEESSELKRACDSHGLRLVQLVAPTTPEERLERILAMCSGFVYCVSLTGVTGAREELAETARQTAEKVRRYTSLPVAVGFGISKPEHIQALSGTVNGVIVGSAVVRLVEANLGNLRQAEKRVFEFVNSLRKATALK